MNFKENARALAKLGLPIVLGSIGHLLMHVVDLAFLGRLSAMAMGSVGPSIAVFSALMMLAIGLMAGLDPLLAQNIGANNKPKADEYFRQSFLLSVGISAFFSFILFFFSRSLFEIFKINPEFLEVATTFSKILGLSMIPMIVFQCARQYLQSISNVKFVVYCMVIGNIVNFIFNYFFIFGFSSWKGGGVVGSAWATLVTRMILMVMILFYARKQLDFKKLLPRSIDILKLKELLQIGIPAGFQFFMEVGIFAATGLFASRLSPQESSAHLISINFMSLLYMIPLGLSSAGAVLVGNLIGEGKLLHAKKMGTDALSFCCLVAGFVVFFAYLFKNYVVGIYTNQSDITEIVFNLLPIGLIFHLFDALQAVATGILRGAGKTAIPAALNFVCYWLIGLPFAYYLCFNLKFSLYGLWWGLAFSLFLVSLFLIAYWKKLEIRSLISK
ncbi:MAG: MATE family efflux transporter [Bacteriovoracaceae bacterium]|nr:MATE family efflux transporter [Bacteriovoracaceae bacterium]